MNNRADHESTLTLIDCDVLVLGAGIAAFQAAIAARASGATVCLVGWAKGASPYIIGFNVALPEAGDTWQAHVEDTLAGGYTLGRRDLVASMCQEAEITFRELVSWGVPFQHGAGLPALRHLSGSRRPRSVYVPDGTGLAVHRVLARKAQAVGVQVRLGLRVLSLLGQDQTGGALAMDSGGRLFAFRAGRTVMAMGGLGQLYGASTYPSDVCGDSYAMALEVGASLIDMEFVQFEPTVVCWPDEVRGMEMPTAMLGDGAFMTNSLGHRFMCRYNPEHCEKQIEKARMALCIQTEIEQGRGTDRGGVWFDARHLPTSVLEGYVSHRRRLLSAGVDLFEQAVHVRPAAHSLMGGISVDAVFQTASRGLFACGEAAGGLHGASRIAGNGASDAVITGRIAGRNAAAAAASRAPAASDVQERAREALAAESQQVSAVLAKVQECLSTHVGIRRSAEGLQQATATLDALAEQIQGTPPGRHREMRRASRAIVVAQSIARCALLREESRGAHFRSDHPSASPNWVASQEVRLDSSGAIVVSRAQA